MTLVAGAGCVDPQEAPSEPIPRLGWCPSWVAGGLTSQHDALAGPDGLRQTLEPSGAMAGAGGAGNGTGQAADAGLTSGGHPLDVYRVRITNVTGRLELRAVAPANANAGERALFVRDYRIKDGQGPSLLAFVTVDAGAAGHEFDVLLASVSQKDAAQPGPVVLEWRGEPGQAPAHVHYEVSRFYRVCGAA